MVSLTGLVDSSRICPANGIRGLFVIDRNHRGGRLRSPRGFFFTFEMMHFDVFSVAKEAAVTRTRPTSPTTPVKYHCALQAGSEGRLDLGVVLNLRIKH